MWQGQGPVLYQLLTEMDHQEQFTGAARIRVHAERLEICTRVLIKNVYSCFSAENEHLMCF